MVVGIYQIAIDRIACQLQQELHHPAFGINDSLGFNGPELRDAGWYEQRQLTRAGRTSIRQGYAPLCFDSLINLALSL
jgi:hypothetical protein